MHRNYLKSGAAAFVSRSVFILAGLLVLWLLTQFLDKDEFGLFLLAQTLSMIVGSILGAGFSNLVLYHCSRAGEYGVERQAARSLLITILLAGSMTGLLAGAGLFAGAEALSTSVFGKPELAVWLAPFAWLVPLEVVKMILVWWHRAEKRTILSIVTEEAAPMAGRALGLGILYVFAPVDSLIVPVFLTVHGLSVLSLLASRHARELPRKLRRPSRWDIQYGFKTMLTRLINQPARSVDVLLVGALVNAESLSEYTIASRLAIFLLLGNQILLPLLVPRMGELLAKGEREQLVQEYKGARFFAVVSCITGAAFYVALGGFILSLFGDYEQAWPLLALLSSVMLLRVGAGADGELLNITGHAGLTLISTFSALIFTFIPGYFLILELGAAGGAYAQMAGLVVMHGVAMLFLQKKEKVNLVNLPALAVILFPVAVLLGTANELLSAIPASLLLIMVVITYALRSDYAGYLRSVLNFNPVVKPPDKP